MVTNIMTPVPLIEFKNVVKKYLSTHGEITALANINLVVNKGEIVGIIGRSGAGKSSLIRCINSLEQPTSGQIIINGRDQVMLTAAELGIARRNMGMIFQQFNLLSRKTVWQNIALPLEMMGKNKMAIKKRVAELLALVGLVDRAQHFPDQLSGGQKQRVAIARALTTAPEILLCDEATSALDPHSTQSILQLLQQINQQLGVTVVLITHEIEVIKSICQHVALLENGHLLQKKTVTDFFTQYLEQGHPQHASVMNYLGEQDWEPRLLSLCQAKNMQGLLLRIRFHGKSAAQPLIAHLVKNFDIEVNILQASLEFIGEDLVGTMIVQLTDNPQLDAGLAYLRAQDITIEELAHVS
jgi:D-methionine transport system ATP-binding protein